MIEIIASHTSNFFQKQLPHHIGRKGKQDNIHQAMHALPFRPQSTLYTLNPTADYIISFLTLLCLFSLFLFFIFPPSLCMYEMVARRIIIFDRL